MRSLFKGALLAAAERLESVYRRCVGQVTPVHKTARHRTYFKQKFKSLILFFSEKFVERNAPLWN